MKVAFLHADKPREVTLAEAFLRGAEKHGHQVFAESLGQESPPGTFDVVGIVGVKSNERYHAHKAAGSHLVMLDKGYNTAVPGSKTRRWEHWRIAVDAHHPTDRLLAHDYPRDRWNKLRIDVKPWRTEGSHVLFAGSSAKYHEFYRLRSPTFYAQEVVTELRRHTDRTIIYRPKPSWGDAVPVAGSVFSRGSQTIHQVLDGAWALVTHGSNACFEALCQGVPSIILGDGVTRPISSTNLADIETPLIATDKQRSRLLCALAYHQFTVPEFASGMAWDQIAEELDA